MTDAVHDQPSPTAPQENPAAPKDPKELYTQEQLAEHARAMAAAQVVAAGPGKSKPLLPHLEESAAELERAYQFLSAIARTDAQPVPAEDWLRDNHHVVQDHAGEGRRHLPRKF